MNSAHAKGDANKMTRIAIVNPERCRPKKCNLECKKNCPVVRQGKLCIEVKSTDKIALISETLCIGCGICIKKCPLDAIQIINLPSSLEKDTTHRYGPNSFKLHRLPTPRVGEVLGLVGTNGIGKSTALKILSGKVKPNLGRFSNAPEWNDILKFFRGSELQNYFTKLLEDKITSSTKPQYVDQIPRVVSGTVREHLSKNDEMKRFDQVVEDYELTNFLDCQIDQLSGGELQRFACAKTTLKNADIYLDVRQRLKVAQNIRKICDDNKYVVVVEHDLSVLDYLSDYICVLYGVAGAYGVVTLPFSVKEGINVFLDGFIPTENLRFRESSLSFKFLDSIEATAGSAQYPFQYPEMHKKFGDSFELTVQPGEFNRSEIFVLLGENGTGKTTFIRMLSEFFNPQQETKKRLLVSYKPQKISPRSEDTVKTMLYTKISESMNNAQFVTDIVKPLNLEKLYDQHVKNLSGGELQRLALGLCLGKVDIYLLDEPSAYLDSEERVNSAKVIKRFILHSKKTAFVVEHDFIMAAYLADKVIVFEGEPSIKATAGSPESMVSGINKFMKSLGVTFRRDSSNYRPRINKRNSVKVGDMSTNSDELANGKRGYIIPNRIFIGNLCPGTTEKRLQDHFEKFGEITDVKIVLDRYNGLSKNFGFVTFKSKRVAQKLIAKKTQYNTNTIRPSVSFRHPSKTLKTEDFDDSGIVADMSNLKISADASLGNDESFVETAVIQPHQ
ncbi:ATP-binding cassette sub-family E member 1 [Thelohanellus kitauei]|uniref:ATP-binding cassette sub-family E member 1 n=1 Tax=Thelohanellus kitauei TaxID=669202 RepID=A0A0C2MH94_THEKT|nr:ATP-binding cassette sub-family E member 1 [Thelohanellus kitauei]